MYNDELHALAHSLPETRRLASLGRLDLRSCGPFFSCGSSLSSAYGSSPSSASGAGLDTLAGPDVTWPPWFHHWTSGFTGLKAKSRTSSSALASLVPTQLGSVHLWVFNGDLSSLLEARQVMITLWKIRQQAPAQPLQPMVLVVLLELLGPMSTTPDLVVEPGGAAGAMAPLTYDNNFLLV